MVIFHSYVKLPEGNVYLYDMYTMAGYHDIRSTGRGYIYLYIMIYDGKYDILMPNSNGWIISPNSKTKDITDSLPHGISTNHGGKNLEKKQCPIISPMFFFAMFFYQTNHDICLSKSPEP